MTIKTVWICEKHYRELQEKVGYEIPVHTIANVFQSKCFKCDEVAEHSICEDVEDIIEIPAERLEVLNA